MRVPGDKSISHRSLMLACLARGTSRIEGLLEAGDVRSTATCLRRIGAEIPGDWSGVVRIPGRAALEPTAERLHCGNSGTTARLLMGILAGEGTAAVLDGDASLRSRPMERVVYPLQAMGAELSYLEQDGRLPVAIGGRATGSLRPLRHRPRVASAQVKSCLLLAGITAGVRVEVREPGRSRDHTERMLRAMGAPVEYGPEDGGARALLHGDRVEDLGPLEMAVPGDLSSAAFLVVAALLSGRSLRVEDVGLNPTRSGVLEVLEETGASLARENVREVAGEPVGDLVVGASDLSTFRVGPDQVPTLLDEVPLLAVLAARIPGTSEIRGAEELRVKESDRLALTAANLSSLGIDCRELDDGLRIRGADEPVSGRVRTGGDHRMAMAFGVLGRATPGRVEVDDPACVAVSYPGFWEDLDRVLAASSR